MTTQQIVEVLNQSSDLKRLVELIIEISPEGHSNHFEEGLVKFQNEEWQQALDNREYNSDDYEDYDSMHYANYGE